jgi:hypothetical protein
MRKSIKAALLSAMVFPGIGHFSLKKPAHGAVLSGVSIVCLYFILATVVDMAQQLSVRIQSGDIPLDTTIISTMLYDQLAGNDGQGINIASFLLVICWLVGIVDSFRIGLLRGNSDDLSE